MAHNFQGFDGSLWLKNNSSVTGRVGNPFFAKFQTLGVQFHLKKKKEETPARTSGVLPKTERKRDGVFY